MAYLSRDALLGATSALLEDDLTIDGVGTVRIRELTAGQRMVVYQASRASGEFDQTVYFGTIVQLGTIQPVLEMEDIQALINGRMLVVETIGNAIWELSAMTPDAFRRRHSSPDTAEPDAGAGAGTGKRRTG